MKTGERTIAPEKLPIIYSDHYDMAIFGLHYLHPFDTLKHGKVYNYLHKKIGIPQDGFYNPSPASEQDLLVVHTKSYLDSLAKSGQIAKIAELPALALIPNRLLQKHLLEPMKYAVGGSILGAKLALEYAWAVNLSGGYTHAKAGSGGAYCFFADIPIAVKKILSAYPGLSVLIVDLDAHQGNGNADILKNQPQVDILDVYNQEIYPGDEEAMKYVKYNFPVNSNITNRQYLEIVDKALAAALTATQPGLIIYNAGTDIYEKDWLGEMKISEESVIKRDEMVFKKALREKIPILMVLAGGYAVASAELISHSLENIIKLVISDDR